MGEASTRLRAQRGRPGRPGALPALAKSKSSTSPNKQCNDVEDPCGNVVSMCSGAKKKETTTELYKQQKASMSGDKGSRGTELDKDFTKLETERRAKTKTAPKQANRNPMSVQDLGLKSYGGSYLGPRS